MRATTEALLVDDNPGDTDLTTDVPSQNSCPSHIHPVLEGAEVKSDPTSGTIPILVFSSPLVPDDIARSSDAGANNYVGKPSDLNGFVTGREGP